MKTLQLELKKKILIIDGNKCTYIPDMSSVVIEGVLHIIPEGFEFLCKGLELTEELAKELVDYWQNMANDGFIYENYKSNLPKKKTAIESVISAVEGKGYYWLKNPMSPYIPVNGKKADKKYMKEYFEAEGKTLYNPIIFVKK